MNANSTTTSTGNKKSESQQSSKNSLENKPNMYAYATAFYLSSIYCGLLSLLLYSYNILEWNVVLFSFIGIYTLSFLMFQYRLKKFVIYKINTIYKELDIIEKRVKPKNPITDDMTTFINEVKEYAKVRKTEIEILKGRDAYRKEFLGNVSHELKTPLFTIQGYILTLLDGAKDKPELCTKYLKRASKGVDRLSFIIQDLDLITKLEVGDLILNNEEFNIIELIKNVFELLEIKASKKNIALEFDMSYSDVYVYADKERIRQVVTNLIENSIKYGNEDGTTEVSIEQLVDEKIMVRVTDNGEGITKQHLPRLFERFYRVSASRSRNEGGSGLGLSIVKHIIEAHNEHIYVESTPNMGSEFSFTLEKLNSSTKN